MAVEKFEGEVTELGKFRRFGDFTVYDLVAIKRDVGAPLILTNNIGIPSEMSEVFKPGLRGTFLTYHSGTFGRRGVFAVKPEGGPAISAFRIPAEKLSRPLAMLCTVLIVFIPFAILLRMQYAGNEKAKKEGKALWGTA